MGALIALAAVAGTLTFADDAGAFCRTTTCDKATTNCRIDEKTNCVRDGTPLRWKSFPITYRFHAAGTEKLDNDNVRAVIREAFSKWENVQCGERGKTSVTFKEGSDIGPDKPLGQKEARDKYGIYFRDQEWPHNDTDESLALTNQVFGVKTGTIDYADIEINTAKFTFRLSDDEQEGNPIDLQAVMIHEVGHYLGLAHSDDPNSIMVARYCQEDSRCHKGTDAARSLSADDKKGVCTIYPPAGEFGGVPSTSGGCAASSGEPAPLAELALTGGLFTLLAAVRRRQRKRVV